MENLRIWHLDGLIMLLRTIIITVLNQSLICFNVIVCICKNINTGQIVESVKNGARSLDDIRARTGASSCCGKCQFNVNRLLNDQLAAETSDLYFNASQSA